ncbi:Cytochrome c oxidase subunit 5B, mitochondrial [Diatrype stigma]|uniref:Cytochrome c oxidase subunit 5B, mitochondrial n=1 Tax=Diatrype stigma TaxID=117547 RepID=A0AAN9YT47_9PEZI
MMRTPVTSLLRSSIRAASARAPVSVSVVPRAAASTHAISNPTLANIEKRWEGMPNQEQAELWMALRDRMKENWAELTLQEKKAGRWSDFILSASMGFGHGGIGSVQQYLEGVCQPGSTWLTYAIRAYWIAFGSHGPRALDPPDEGRKVILYTAVGILTSFAIFATMRAFAGPAPSTMNREYQEASNEYLKAQNAEPLTGLSSEVYKGPGMVQSPPKN